MLPSVVDEVVLVALREAPEAATTAAEAMSSASTLEVGLAAALAEAADALAAARAASIMGSTLIS